MAPSIEQADKPAAGDVEPRPWTIALVVSLVLAALGAAAAAWACWRLPADAQVPMHWNAAGQVDAYGGRGSLFLLPAVVLFLTLLFAVLPHIEPRRLNLRRSANAYRTVWIAVVGFMTVIQAAIVATALGHSLPVGRVAMGGVGVLFLVLGSVLGSVRSNFFFGVRTPWTLSSELSWSKTHRLAGRLFATMGVLLAAAALLRAPDQALVYGMLAAVGVIAAVLVLYSYCIWRLDTAR